MSAKQRSEALEGQAVDILCSSTSIHGEESASEHSELGELPFPSMKVAKPYSKSSLSTKNPLQPEQSKLIFRQTTASPVLEEHMRVIDKGPRNLDARGSTYSASFLRDREPSWGETNKVRDTVASVATNLFNDKNLESFIDAENPLLHMEDAWEGTRVEVIRFKFNGLEAYVDLEAESITLEALHQQCVSNSAGIEEEGTRKESERLQKVKERIAKKARARVGAENFFHRCLELNTYPLDVRFKATDSLFLQEIENRLNVTITSQGRRLNDSFLFIDFSGEVEDNVNAACEEVRLMMDNETVDEAKETELRDLMRMVLSVGDVTKPSISVRRHCVLVGLFPVQCVLFHDELVLVESRGLSLTENQVLEKTALQIKAAMETWVVVNEVSNGAVIPKARNSSKGNSFVRNTVYENIDLPGAEFRRGTHNIHPKPPVETFKNKTFDQICLHAVFVTVCGLVQNAVDAYQRESKGLCATFNTKAFVNISDQRAMQVVKMQGNQLLATIRSHSKSLEELIDNDIRMAFMNLETMKEHSFMYRMTVNNKMTLSQTDRRVSIASHDIELLLYSFLLRYARMENEMTSQENIIVSTEEFQELQGINVQTKVLVANTLFTVLATAIGFCSYVTGAFGMNLNNENVVWPEWTFTIVCAVTLVFIFVSTKLAMILLRRSAVLPETAVFSLRDRTKDDFSVDSRTNRGIIDLMVSTLTSWQNGQNQSRSKRSE